jgi:hypothetical protein
VTDEFQRATGGSVNSMRMADRECVLRFLTFKLKSHTQYTSRDDLDSFLNDCMQEINETSTSNPAYLDALRFSFKRAMDAAHTIFGNQAFRKIDPDRMHRLPISKTLFEVWAVNLDKLCDSQIQHLIECKEELMNKFTALMDDQEFMNAISSSTGDPRRVKCRFSKIEEIIEETLHA